MDLEGEFQIFELNIAFRTLIPAAMHVESSYDWGETWKIYRYFATDCEKSYPGFTVADPSSLDNLALDEIVCVPQKGLPWKQNQINYSVSPPLDILPTGYIYPTDFNSYSRMALYGLLGRKVPSRMMRQLFKTTNIRIHLQSLQTVDEESLVANQHYKERHYFSIYNIVIMGSP